MKNSYADKSNALHQNDNYLERLRLYKLLHNAIAYPLVLVCAGAGYGKTRAVESFISANNSYSTWRCLSEQDNIATYFWEHHASAVTLGNPEAKARLMEIGFPDRDEAFVKYHETMSKIVAKEKKCIRVYDDFHFLHNPAIFRFFTKVLGMMPQHVTIILISRTIPDFSVFGAMHEKLFTIQEDVLCFTEDEIAQYFRQLDLSATREDIRNTYNDTQGWAFAVNLIGRSLHKKHKYERYALDAMKKNIFRIIEAEIFQAISEPLLRFLLRISLLDHQPAGLVRVLAKDDAFIREMEFINAYIRYDFNMDMYLFHHFFRDYLQQKQKHILTDEERREVYQTAGAWYEAGDYHMSAFSYYEKAGDYDAITRKVAKFDMHVPLDVAQYALDSFDRAPDAVKSLNPLFPSLYLRLKARLGQLDEALALAERYAADYEARPESPEKNRSLFSIYAHWAFLRLLLSPYTDVYDFDVYYKKMSEYFDKNPFEIIGRYKSISQIAWISNVGSSRPEAQEEYIDALSRSIPYTSNILHGMHLGLDDLARGELYFCRGKLDDAEQYLRQAIHKACSKDQYATHHQALIYLMRIAFFRGNFASATDLLQEMDGLLNKKDYSIRYTMYDIANGIYQLTLGQPENVPEWLKSDFSPYTHPSFLANYENRVKTQYRYSTRQYSTLLAFIETEMNQQTILFFKIWLKILQSLSLYQLKQRRGAIAALTEAYHLAEPNRLTVLFIQFAKDMRTLTAVVLKDDTCPIPKKWLEDINRKSSTYAKRQAKMISEYRLANNVGDKIVLTVREIAILKDLSQGLSRTEIAAGRNISVNTVKMAIHIIYDKLYVASLPDAIRVAVDRKII